MSGYFKESICIGPRPTVSQVFGSIAIPGPSLRLPDNFLHEGLNVQSVQFGIVDFCRIETEPNLLGTKPVRNQIGTELIF